MIEVVTLHVKDAIATRPVVLKGDLSAEFEQLPAIKVLAEAAIEIGRDVCRSRGHGVGKFEDEALDFSEWRDITRRDRGDFRISQSGFSAHGRVDVHSKRTADLC